MTHDLTPDDEQTIAALRRAMAAQVRGHHLDPGIAAAVLDRLETRPAAAPRRRRRELVAVAACLAFVIALAVGYALTRGDSAAHRSTPAAHSGCAGVVATGSLPTWARDGFDPPSTPIPHVIGARGQILAALFGYPLHSPPAKGRNNKILWVAKHGGTGPLVIHAALAGTDRTVTRSVAAGPGPSSIDLPAPGCWQFTLTWAGQHDTMSIPYVP